MDQAPIRVTADGLTMVGVDQHRDYLESVRDGRRRIIRFEAEAPDEDGRLREFWRGEIEETGEK